MRVLLAALAVSCALACDPLTNLVAPCSPDGFSTTFTCPFPGHSAHVQAEVRNPGSPSNTVEILLSDGPQCNSGYAILGNASGSPPWFLVPAAWAAAIITVPRSGSTFFWATPELVCVTVRCTGPSTSEAFAYIDVWIDARAAPLSGLNVNPSGLDTCSIGTALSSGAGFTYQTAVQTCTQAQTIVRTMRTDLQPGTIMAWSMANPVEHAFQVWLASGASCTLGPNDDAFAALAEDAGAFIFTELSAVCPSSSCCVFFACANNKALDGACASIAQDFSVQPRVGGGR